MEQQVESVENRFLATFLLACVGDVIGYKNGDWEFNCNGEDIHKQCTKKFGGVLGIDTSEKKGWIYSDDTVMHYATAEALVKPHKTFDQLMTSMALEYIDCWKDMGGRAPGATCAAGVHKLARMKWNELPYERFGGGCGGSMRAQCIGLMFSGQENRDTLVACGIESGRLTHTHVNGFMGSMVSAAFTALALEQIPVKKWGHILINDLIPRAEKYLEYAKRDLDSIKKDMVPFKQYVADYLVLRGIVDGVSEPVFPAIYGVKERDKQYQKWSFKGWGGASGHDSVIIAYDALLGCAGSYEEMLNRAALHGGDSDSTGTIAAAWYGAMYGFQQVPKHHYENIEGHKHLTRLAKQLFALYDAKKINVYPTAQQEEQDVPCKQ